jgi:hypothetical protein
LLDPLITRPAIVKPLTYLDAIVAVLMVASLGWLLHASSRAAAEAIRLYGHNVDSGAIEGITATLYCAPNAVLFAFAAVAMWRAWRIRWFAQGIAIVWLIGPVMFATFAKGV